MLAGHYARPIYSYLRIISVNKIRTKTQTQKWKLHGERKFFCSRENDLKSEYVEMLSQEMLIKADPGNPDEERNSEVNEKILISYSLYNKTMSDSNILQNYTEVYQVLNNWRY